MKQALAGLYPEVGAGDFTKLDGTVEFYGRISALLRPDMEVLDLGAGRGWQLEIPDPFRRGLVTLQGRVRRLVGVDVDPAVLTNPGLDEALVYDGTTLPFADQSFDLVLSDWVLEHIDDPAMFTAEVARVLRPGGWFCARTPHTVSISAIGSRMVPNRSHARFLTKVQKGEREAKDVFPTRYRLNTLRAIRRYFPAPAWDNCSYTYSPEPAYHFGSRTMVRLMAMAQYLKAPFAGENLFVFVRKH